MSTNIMWFADIGLTDLELVGGKNSSLRVAILVAAGCNVREVSGWAGPK
jgi:phosphoenolpyruvate synthase/pyruvate phosphate dikinase